VNRGRIRIQRFSNSLTRRQMGALVTTAAFGTWAPRVVQAQSTPWSVAIVPDPQYLATPPNAACAMYDRLIQWAIENRNTVIDGVPLNLKGFIQVGDCQNDALAGTANNQELIAVNAWNRALPENLFVAWCCGNHDYEGGGNLINRSRIGHVWRTDTNGAWAPANLAARYGSGIDLGNGDVALWGGVYNDAAYPQSSANNYIRIRVGSRKILIIALEFFPRSAVLNWAKELHDNWPDHEVWLTTHGYMDTLGNQCGRTVYGPSAYSMGPAPSSNSGQEMWAGSDGSWPGLTRWPRLGLVTCGHWIDGYSQGWVWQKRQDRGLAGQTTLQVFCDAQTADRSNACATGGPDSHTDVAHLMLFRVWPTWCEAYLVSTNTGLWTGPRGVRNSAAPIQLFSVPFPLISGLPDTSPGVSITGILNSATGQPAITPGSWVSIYGTRLADSIRAWQDSDFVGGTLPVVIDRVSVRFDGRSAAVYYVSPGQINVQAPDGIGAGNVMVEVTTPSGSARGTVDVQPLAPGFFAFRNGYAAAVHADGVYVAPAGYFGSGTTSRSARAGDVLMLYGTGFGPTLPAAVSGRTVREPAPLAPSSLLLVYVGEVRANVRFAGLVAPGQYQINVVVPNVPDGDQAIVAEVNGFRSQPGISIPVKSG
jgi:uncharacterized protein (TIGR03437 family)